MTGVAVLPAPRERLAECEHVIERGMASFIEVGNALARIRDERLYLETNGTFEEYCRDRWGLSRAYAYRQIDAAAIAYLVSPIGDIASESNARALVPLKDEPDLLREVWQAVIDSSEKPTAALIRKVMGTDKEEEPTDKEAWDALQAYLRSVKYISDEDQVIAVIPRERHASTARRARKLAQVLARIAYRLEHVEDGALPNIEDMANDIARNHPSPGTLSERQATAEA